MIKGTTMKAGPLQAWITVMGVDHSEIEDRQEVYVIPTDKVIEIDSVVMGEPWELTGAVCDALQPLIGKKVQVLVVECDE